MESHTNVILVLEPVRDRANNVLTNQLQANLHAVNIAAVAVDTGDVLTMKFSMIEC